GRSDPYGGRPPSPAMRTPRGFWGRSPSSFWGQVYFWVGSYKGRGWGPGHGGWRVARAQSYLAPTLALRAWRSPLRRENETAQHRNAKDPERRWVLEHEQGKLERTMAPWPACPSDSDRCDANAEHTLRREPIPTQATRRRSPPRGHRKHGSLCCCTSWCTSGAVK